jgi:hypothetical protein
VPEAPDTIRSLVEQLSGEAVKDFLRNLRHHVEVQRRLAQGELLQKDVNAAYVRYARREGRGYRDEVARLTAQYYRDLVAVGAKFSEQFYEEVLQPPEWTTPAGDGEGPRRVSIELHGLPGREVVRRVTLENTGAEELSVTFEIGAVRGPTGESFTAPLSVQPAQLTIAPGGREQITLRLALLPSLFVPGNVYTSTVGVHGHEELAFDIVIWAEEEVDFVGVAPAKTETVPPRAEKARPEQPEKTPKREQKPETVATATGQGGPFVVRCPTCGRTFSRTRPNPRLNPHKRPSGTPCPGRRGKLVEPKAPAAPRARGRAAR